MLPPRLLALFFFCCGLPFKVERSLLAHSPLSLSLSLSFLQDVVAQINFDQIKICLS